MMHKHLKTQLAYLLAVGLAISIFVTAVHGFNGTSSATPVTKEVWEPITATTATKKPGILAWLGGFLPDGIRFTGPVAGTKNYREVLATANCFNSGAGVSCNGFRSLEDYVAAVRVSEDLGIPIQNVRQKMQSGKTLQQAVQELRPGVKGQIEAMRAQQEARKILKGFST